MRIFKSIGMNWVIEEDKIFNWSCLIIRQIETGARIALQRDGIYFKSVGYQERPMQLIEDFSEYALDNLVIKLITIIKSKADDIMTVFISDNIIESDIENMFIELINNRLTRRY
jgi:hypothetical protein